MVTIILVTLAGILVLLVLGGLAKSVQKHDRQTNELNSRLGTLEDRFYHPENYREAFFRPSGKNKDSGKES
jgi:hypothetical protein